MSKCKIFYCRSCKVMRKCYFVEIDGDYDYRCGQCNSYALEYRPVHTKYTPREVSK